MTTVRLRLKSNTFEVEVEGPREFILEEFPQLIKDLLDPNGGLANVKGVASKTSPSGSVEFDQSTNTIAAILNVKTGPDLAIAAAAHLALVKGYVKFSRKEILDEMQGATTYYQQNYSGNFSKILQSLTKAKRFNLVASQTYALSKAERDRIESLLSME